MELAPQTTPSLHHGPTALAPAPWLLRGEGVIMLVRQSPGSTSPSAPGQRLWPFACVMFVDYAESPVGPYHELLYIPGSALFGARRLPTISKIYVSSQASVDSGRHNWGIPKELAAFDVHEREGVKHVAMRVNGEAAVTLAMRRGFFALPVSTAFLPRTLHTLGQILAGRTYTVTPSARGLVRRARVLEAWSEPRLFPPLSAERVVMAAQASRVRMRFPEAAHG